MTAVTFNAAQDRKAADRLHASLRQDVHAASAPIATPHLAMIKRFAMIALGGAAMAVLVAAIAMVKLSIFYPHIFR